MLVDQEPPMNDLAHATAVWWSYAEANPTVVGVVVVALAIAAIAFVGTRVVARARRRR